MGEELNEHDFEERLYAMLHHVDETQNNLIDSHQNKVDDIQFAENGPRSTLRRYWRVGPDANPYQKTNTNKNPVPPTVIKSTKDPAGPTAAKTTKDPVGPTAAKTTKDPVGPTVAKTTKDPAVPTDAKASSVLGDTPKEERSPPKPPSPIDLSIFQCPVPQNAKKTIEFLDHDLNNSVVLESSDEDEVVEVALPPKPTITIESSDEDELQIVKQNSPQKADPKSNSGDRAVSASPVPSVVSSISDEFIRGDCIALNISSRHPDKHSFDFSLHGSDLLGQTNASSKKKKRKKNKEAVTSTPIVTTEKPANTDTCFATPKSKAKNKKQRSKLLTEKSVPNPDIYDSDSNLSTIDTNKNKNPYIVTDKSVPSIDVYESDSNQSEIVKEMNTDQSKDKYVIEAYNSDSSVSDSTETLVSKKNSMQPDSFGTIDLTKNDSFNTVDETGIIDSIVMGNVIGFTESMDYGDETHPKGDISKYVSSKVPSILNDNLDFDNLKGKEKICKKRRYSLTTLRAEMEKFYNESWGGEDFNHMEIQKNMSRDKSLWAIDPKDRMQTFAQRKAKCGYCNRVGHRDDTCRQKPPVCYMCGNTGHYEPRCPDKICVNCGAPNFMYSSMCRNCSWWPNLKCAECGQCGHPASHCPDVWRRYHNTISVDTSLEKCTQPKKPHQQYCSGCARRGHLVHACRVSLPFSGLPINSPHVQLYRAVYAQAQARAAPPRSKSFSEDSPRPDRNAKRLSKSPTAHETHLNKKRNVSVGDADLNTRSPAPVQKNTKETNKNKNKSLNKSIDSVTQNAPDFIPVSSSNHDNKGRVIQDNEVSDTSEVVTSARIFITLDITNKLKTKEGEDWLKDTMGKFNVTVVPAGINSYLSITGKLADQEVFQTELREWVQTNTKTKSSTTTERKSRELINRLPKTRETLLKHLGKAIQSLNQNWGDPRKLYKELSFCQQKHEKLIKQKVISPERLWNSRGHINTMLKCLNIVLVGQAGLGGGVQRLNRLISCREQLEASRETHVPDALRKEINDHYLYIFSCKHRDDYSELMNEYYLTHAAPKIVKKKNKRKANKPAPKANVNKQSIPEKSARVEVAPPPPRQNSGPSNPNAPIIKQLVSFNKKLNSLRHSGAYDKSSKHEMLCLIRRIHSSVAILFNNESINSKQLKKVKKVQQEVQNFFGKV